MKAIDYKVWKKIVVSYNIDGNPIYFNIVDTDIATGKALGFYTESHGDYETLLGNYSLVNEIELVARDR